MAVYSQNILQSNKFKMVIAGDDIAAGNIEFYLQACNIPDVTIGEVRVPFRGNVGYLPGEQAEWAPLQADLIVDENLKGFKEVFDWMMLCKSKTKPQTRDITIVIMSSHNNESCRFVLRNAFPTTAGSLQLDVRNTAPGTTPLVLPVTFRYDYFDLEYN